MRHTTTILLAAAGLALAGCSSGGEPAKTVTVTATPSATPSLSASEARQACVDAWSVTIEQTADDEEPETPTECDGLSEQAGMYMEALQARNTKNRESLDACLEDPTCTSWPLPTP